MSENKKFNTDKIINIMGAVANNRYLTAIRNGMSVVIPITIIGSIFTIILNFPVDSWQDFIAPYSEMFSIPIDFTINFMSVYVVIGIASNLSDDYKIDRVSTSVLAVLAFLMTAISPESISEEAAENANLSFSGTVLPTTNFGAAGLFSAIVVSIITVEIVRFFIKKNLVIRMPKGVPTAVINSFTALIPGAVVMALAFIVKVVFNFDINAALQWVFSPIGAFGNDNLASVIIPILLITVIWVFGIHGMVIATPILYPYWYANLNENVSAIASGTAAPHFMTEQFFQWFIWIGGAGATLSLALLMAFLGKSQFAKTMGRVTLVPGIFNINEPLIFGIPIIMNPFFAIPFILAPVAMGVITWLSMGVLNIVSNPIAVAPWTLPAPIGALMATGFDWKAAVLAIINILIAAAIYYPFFKAWDKRQLQQEKEAAENGE
ncbi:MAG: PTS transporter subunit EIIC [Tetragenococcus koreensis]|nr:PTS transporter subunit EIIC [Tetragenococcus koreensis]MDN6748915.1 PTS transporter subunit EIIC [Staphylococcus equorum]MDN6146191.1 PTS transporter subunit EIIC [Tetragenococcus koreensis]MDN6266636.1 PTS transporter subunit EIIC [Tetragenococcus koreensis]MDN6579668.1 PTS transporter subunit EIIC [Tetragenococcus koreensis]